MGLFRDGIQFRSCLVDLVVRVVRHGGGRHRLTFSGERLVGRLAEHVAEVSDRGAELCHDGKCSEKVETAVRPLLRRGRRPPLWCLSSTVMSTAARHPGAHLLAAAQRLRVAPRNTAIDTAVGSLALNEYKRSQRHIGSLSRFCTYAPAPASTTNTQFRGF
jgi:hypothetical protein